MSRYFHDLYQLSIGAQPGEPDSGIFKDLAIRIIKFISVAVSLRDLLNSIGKIGLTIRYQLTWICTKAHGTTLLRIAVPFFYFLATIVIPFLHQVDHRIRRAWGKFGTVSQR